MSYRSFKRVLGETSLERKCRFLFGACLLLLITGSFWIYGKRTEELVEKQNRNKGQLLVDTIMTLYHWEHITWKDLLGGIDATRKRFPPGQDESHSSPGTAASSPDDGTRNPDTKDFLESLTKNLQNQEYTWGLLQSDAAGGRNQPQDDYEREVLKQFPKTRHLSETPDKAEEVEYRERYLPDRGVYQYFQPVRAKKDCILCHQSMGWPGLAAAGIDFSGTRNLGEGDLMAVVKVQFLNHLTQRDLSVNRAILLATAILTVFLAMVASYAIVRYVIVKPLNHLRDVSDAISHGNTDLRADIHTADEFEELGVAFNRMLRHLMEAQEGLRQANANLDGKVDELAQLNMRLYEMNRLKNDFLATMSHELRTPLNSIIGFSDVLNSIDSLDDKQKRYVQNIQKSGRVLLDMINDILDLAKIESGKMAVRLSEFRIEQVIAAQCDMARPLTERKNLDLEAEIEPGLPSLYQDQNKVQQILSNLLSNAIKFTPEGGRIAVAAKLGDGDALLLRVTDTGVGIAQEDQTTIFEKFRQGRTVLPGGDAMTREYSGSGLGLSIVKELCKLLGGEIGLESELGKGSVFTVRLPMTLAEPPGLDAALAGDLEALARRHIDLDHPLDRPVAASDSANPL
ncbi:MAG: sensor histidine kinase [Pirellulales bacterium]